MMQTRDPAFSKDLHVRHNVRGPFLEPMRDILQSDACIRRGLYQRTYVDKLLAEPEARFTRIQGSKLWHLALLEWWLQINVDGVVSGAG
jgi:asparagine synthase (glutamine-hydrolysing)